MAPVPAAVRCPVRTWSPRLSAFVIRRWQDHQAVAIHGQHFQLGHHVCESAERIDPADAVVRSITPRLNAYPCRPVGPHLILGYHAATGAEALDIFLPVRRA